MNFEKTDNRAVVYRVSDISITERISAPQKAKSRFNDEHDDVEWGDLRAEMKKVSGETFVIVGECSD